MANFLERLAYATKRAQPYWRWILAGILFVFAALVAYVIWRKLERLKQLENEYNTLKEKLKHDKIKDQLITNAAERKKLAGEIEAAEKRVAETETRIKAETEATAVLKESLAKAQSWKDLK